MYICICIYSVDLAQQARDVLGADTSHGHFNNREGIEEMQRTVTSQLQMGLSGGPQRPELPEFVRCADTGNLACAYQAGICYKRRLLGKVRLAPSFLASQRELLGALEAARPGDISWDATGTNAQGLGVLETNALSFKYLSQAAEGGLALAMQSLADNYEKGCGVRTSMRSCREWYWRACLASSVGAPTILDSKSVLFNELRATLDMLGQMEVQLKPFQGFCSGGPKLCSLVVALHRDLATISYKLPPFAATAPTLQVSNRPRPGTAPAPIIGLEMLKNCVVQFEQLQRRHHEISFSYGRRGIAQQATALSMGEASRPLDAQLLIVPPPPAAHDLANQLSRIEIEEWEHVAVTVPLEVTCVHRQGGPASCSKCLAEGILRLQSVATASVVLSLSEALPCRGHLAIFRGSNGILMSETFKDYGIFFGGGTSAAKSQRCQTQKSLHILFCCESAHFQGKCWDF